jgi:acetyl-CoA carboxylase biotin carboxyl carrier protein
MDLERIRELMALLEDSGFTELEVRNGDQSVRLVRPAPGTPVAVAPATGAPAGVREAAGTGQAAPTGETQRAPMAGTFYGAPEPGAEPYVCEGQTVAVGEVLCIIESMKMMNEIKSQYGGVCRSVAVANGQPVSAGDPLFVIG